MSNTLDVGFCLQALASALRQAPAPYIFNSDQGSQFTCPAFEQALLDAGCRISRDGRGRATDNAFIERLWRPVKWEHTVTVGSPLGIRAIKQQLATPLVAPPCLGQWFNAYDDRDVLALVPLDAQTFNVTSPIENKGDVLNFTGNRHGIEDYLADPAVARQVVLGLQSH